MQPQDHKELFPSCFLVLIRVCKVFSPELFWIARVDDIASVHLVVRDWVAQRFEMYSDLVRPPCLWIAKDYRVISFSIIVNKLKPRESIFRLVFVLELHLFGRCAVPLRLYVRDTVYTMIAIRLIHLRQLLSLTLFERTCFPEIPENSCKINFSDLIRNHSLSELISIFVCLCEEYNPRCLSI